MNQPADNHLQFENGLRISLGPDELNELWQADYLETSAASIEIVDYQCKPYAKAIGFGQGNNKGLFFAIDLPNGTEIPLPDPGQETIIAYIPDKRIKPKNPFSRELYEQIIGPNLGGIALIAHGAFNDQESIKGNT